MEMQYNYNNELAGKISLVTGGTKGTGKDTFENRENKQKPKRKDAEAALSFVPANEIP